MIILRRSGKLTEEGERHRCVMVLQVVVLVTLVVNEYGWATSLGVALALLVSAAVRIAVLFAAGDVALDHV
jgi:hypothetical protein